MLTGMDVFSTQLVAHRHKGPLRPEVSTLAEILRAQGYHTVSVGFQNRPSSRGFDEYLNYAGMGTWAQGREPKAQKLNDLALPALDRLVAGDKPFLFVPAPYGPPFPLPSAAPVRTHLLSRQRVRPRQQVDGPGAGVRAI